MSKKLRLSDITLDKVGGLKQGAIVVCTKDLETLTKGKQYVLLKGIGVWWHVVNDVGSLCSEMKFFVHLKDWREKQLGDLGI